MTIAHPPTGFTQPPPLSVYVHFPWCVSKCPYCDFNSHALKTTLAEADYIALLHHDGQQTVSRFADCLNKRRVSSIFLGGGTPSLFSGKAIGQCLDNIASLFSLDDNVEITLEANPGTTEHAVFQDYRAAGVNRLSLGVQSFNNDLLKRCGRIHDSTQAIKAIESAQNAGFNSINIDLMFALPEQTHAQAMDCLTQAIALAPQHISWYQLTLEPNTAFYRQPPPLPSPDAAYGMQQAGTERLTAAGFAHYEVSAFAKNGFTCRHNINYWQYGDYLGLGAGAHSKLTDVKAQTITRLMKIKHPKRYSEAAQSENGSFIQSEQRVTDNARAFEFMLNALRLNRPLALADFSARTGLAASVIDVPIQAAITQGLLERNNNVLTKTALGQRFVDDIVQLFLHH